MTRPIEWTNGQGQRGGTEPPEAEPGEAFHGSGVRHGTQSGWKLHQKLGEDACEACRTAKAHYDWRWRQADLPTRRNRARAKAQHQAHMELVRRHQAEYDDLYEERVAAVYADQGLGTPPMRRRRTP